MSHHDVRPAESGVYAPARVSVLTDLGDVPTAGGTYVLELELARARRIRIGRLGEFAFERGRYLYVGSACGPGGLRARLRHHLVGAPRPHWHIDYLRAHASVRAIAFSTDRRAQECRWAAALLALPGVSVPVACFGASDCRAACAAHLVRLGAVTSQGWRRAISTAEF